MPRIPTLLAAPALAALIMTASPADATRPSTATLQVSVAGASPSSTFASGSSLVFSGCGYQPGVGVNVNVQTPSALAFFGATAGADGCFTTERTVIYRVSDVGSYTAMTYLSGRRRVTATTAFTVTS